VVQNSDLAAVDGHADEDTVGNMLAQTMPFLDDPILGAIVPWFCDKLGSDLSIKDYRRALELLAANEGPGCRSAFGHR